MSPRIDERSRQFPSPEGCEIIKPGGVSPRTHRREDADDRGRKLIELDASSEIAKRARARLSEIPRRHSAANPLAPTHGRRDAPRRSDRQVSGDVETRRQEDRLRGRNAGHE